MEKNLELQEDLPKVLEAAMLLHLPHNRGYDLVREANSRAIRLGRLR